MGACHTLTIPNPETAFLRTLQRIQSCPSPTDAVFYSYITAINNLSRRAPVSSITLFESRPSNSNFKVFIQVIPVFSYCPIVLPTVAEQFSEYYAFIQRMMLILPTPVVICTNCKMISFRKPFFGLQSPHPLAAQQTKIHH